MNGPRAIDPPRVRLGSRRRVAQARERMLDAIARGDYRPAGWQQLLAERRPR